MMGLRKSAAMTEQQVFLRKGGAVVEQEVYLRKGGVLYLISTPMTELSVDVTPNVYGAAASASPVSITTSFAFATAHDGSEPYSYSWERTDGGSGTWQIISPNSSTTSFRRLAVPPTGEPETAAFACTVTDSKGASVVSSGVDASVINYSSGGA